VRLSPMSRVSPALTPAMQHGPGSNGRIGWKADGNAPWAMRLEALSKAGAPVLGGAVHRTLPSLQVEKIDSAKYRRII
jgi:hypothetical protein